MATGPRTRGISGVGVGTRPGRHQGGVQLVVTRPGEASAGLRSKSCNISPSDLLTFLSFSTEMLQFVFRGTAPNISISAILCGATGLRHVDCRDIWLFGIKSKHLKRRWQEHVRIVQDAFGRLYSGLKAVYFQVQI